MAGTLRYLEKKEKTAILRFASHLMDDLERQVLDIKLFGSKTRGDFTPDSDLDVFIVLDSSDWDIKDQIRFLAADVSLEYDVLLNTHILSRERWEELARHQATLWREVQRDGVALMPRPERAPKAN
jgi:predicted nucleotidyltransferase